MNQDRDPNQDTEKDVERDQVTVPPDDYDSNDLNTEAVTERAGGELARAAQNKSPLTVRYFGDYEIIEEIARGGMGVVYKARQVSLKRVVALKMILAGQLAGDEEVQRFHAEAEAAAILDHPGIVPIYEIGEHQDQHYFSMGFVDGESLADKVKGGPLAPPIAAGYLMKTANAVAYAHDRNVIHRDLKPANVLIDSDDQPKVTDFGLAKQVEADSNLTQSGAVMGTPSYMPPEQAAGRTEEVNELADVYSLGGILYCLITGRAPFQAASSLDTLMQVLDKEPVSPRASNPEIPVDLETICLKCLQKDPSRRYQSASDLSDDLGRFLRREPVVARPVGRIERTWRWCRRKPTHAALFATAMSLVLVITIGGPIVALQQASLRGIADGERNKAQSLAIENQRIAASEREARQNAELTLYVNQIGAAHREWESDRVSSAWDQLNATEEKLRDWEYWYLHSLFSSNQRTLGPDDRKALSVALSADGSCIASGGADGTIQLWNRTNDELIRVLTGHTDLVTSVDVGPRGKSIVSSSNDGTIKLWDVESGNEPKTLQGHKVLPTCVAFNSKGDRIASGGFDKTVRIWNADTGEQLVLLEGHTSYVWSVDFSPDGTRVVSASDDRSIRLWNATTGEETLTLQGHVSPVLIVKWSADGTRVISGSGNGTMVVWDAETGEELRKVQTPSNLHCLALSPDGMRVAYGDDQVIGVWDLVTGARTNRLKGHTGVVDGIAFSPDGATIVSVAESTKLWNSENRQEVVCVGHSSHVQSLGFSADGEWIASGSNDGSIRRWRVDVGEEILSIQGGGAFVAVSRLGDKIASGNIDGSISVFRPSDGQEVCRLEGHEKPVNSLAFNAEGTLLLSGSSDKTLRLWDIASGDNLLVFRGHESTVSSAAFHDESRSAVSGSHDGTIRVWNLTSGLETLRMEGHQGPVNSVYISPDGKSLVSAGHQDCTIRLWGLENGNLLRTFQEQSSVFSVAFSPNGSRIASGHGDDSIRIWDLVSGKPVLSLHGHQDWVSSVAFSKNGDLASASWDKTIRIWPASSADNGSDEEAR